ncbi:MAG: hypothetical protein H5T97_05835 [Firmicutes bacterium]|nr:hypothetical protein [Bacillota bacterium]
MGVLQFADKTDGGLFEPGDLEMGLAFAGPAAVGIENTRLFDDRRDPLLSSLRTLAAAPDARVAGPETPLLAPHHRAGRRL